MIIYPTRTIKDHLYTSTISIVGFGNETLSEEEEKQNLQELPQTLKYSEISFVGNMAVDEDNLPYFVEDEDADETTYDVVKLNLTNKEIPVDENFTATYSVDANSLKAYLSSNDVITDVECLARAMILLWETRVIEKLQELLTISREHVNNFTEAATEVTI